MFHHDFLSDDPIDIDMVIDEDEIVDIIDKPFDKIIFITDRYSDLFTTCIRGKQRGELYTSSLVIFKLWLFSLRSLDLSFILFYRTLYLNRVAILCKGHLHLDRLYQDVYFRNH